MSKQVKYDVSKVSRELLEEFARFHLCFGHKDVARDPVDAISEIGKKVVKAAEVPLRTRAQVDADIVSAVRKFADEHDWHTTQVRGLYGVGAERLAFKLKSIIDEETSD